MCSIITNNYKINNNQKIYIDLIKKKLKSNIDNPKLKIENITIENNNNTIKKLYIIQDGYLIAGTKQRVAKLFIKKLIKENKEIDTLLYAGASNGFGIVATAYAAYKLGLKSEVFLSNEDFKNKDLINTRQINTLLALNSKITLCKSFSEAREAEYKTSNDPIKKFQLPNYYIVPMGLNDDNRIMVELLSKQIKKASICTIMEKNNNLRIWLVAGSGGIAMSILKAFPNAKLFLYLTGSGRYRKIVNEWGRKEKNVTILDNDKVLNESNINKKNRSKYYSSVKNYDDMIWPYVKKYGKDGDFIWNVSSDDYLYL